MEGNPLSLVDPEGLQVRPRPVPIGPGGAARPIDPTEPWGPTYIPNPIIPLLEFIKNCFKDDAADCKKQWEEDVNWCDANWNRYTRKGDACHRWAEGNFDRCLKGSSREPWRL